MGLEDQLSEEKFYANRGQTRVKHYILEKYLEGLAYKVLHGYGELTYVDGFSGPWESKDENYGDTSFGLAIRTLKTVQAKARYYGKRPTIRCVFVEKSRKAFSELKDFVDSYNSPETGFETLAINSEFVDAIPQALEHAKRSFLLTFIDPKGWTGYPYDKIRPLLGRPGSEVLINFMYDHVNRFRDMDDPKIIESLEPILGGKNWQDRLDSTAEDRSKALMALARSVLKEEGDFRFVASTCVSKELSDRPHFYLLYGTRHPSGIQVFRDVESKALLFQEFLRRTAKQRKEEEEAGMGFLFGPSEPAIDREIREFLSRQIAEAKESLLTNLSSNNFAQPFKDVWPPILEEYPLRYTNVRDVCVELCQEGKIENTWAVNGRRKPEKDDLIKRC